MMDYVYEIKNIEKSEILASAFKMKSENYRLVQISCTVIDDLYEINYSFGKNYDFINLRTVINGTEEIISISSIYGPAFLYENELKDLFGIKINHISLDYNGNLYKLAVNTPFAAKSKDLGGNSDE